MQSFEDDKKVANILQKILNLGLNQEIADMVQYRREEIISYYT